MSDIEASGLEGVLVFRGALFLTSFSNLPQLFL